MVRWAADAHGDADAVQAEDGTTWSFGELAARVDEVARALAASGIEPGNRVGIWAPNVTTWVAAGLGVHAAGPSGVGRTTTSSRSGRSATGPASPGPPAPSRSSWT